MTRGVVQTLVPSRSAQFISGAGGMHMLTTPVAVPQVAAATAFSDAKQSYVVEIGGIQYIIGGDRTPITVPFSPTSGRQEMVAMNVAANTFTLVQDFWLPGASQGNPSPSGRLMFSDPDDCAFAFARQGKIILSNSTSNHGAIYAPDQADGTYASSAFAFPVFGHVMEWTPSLTLNAGVWRDIRVNLEWTQNHLANAYYDAQTDCVLCPTCVGQNLLFVYWRVADGLDLSARQTIDGVPNSLPSWGSFDFHQAGLAGDPNTRTVYGVDIAGNYQPPGLWAWNLDLGANAASALTFEVALTGLSASGQSELRILHDPLLNALIVFANFIWVYELATRTLTRFPRSDGYFPRDYGSTDAATADTMVLASSHFRDSPTGDIVSLGTIDFAVHTTPGLYWRHRFSRS